MVSDWQRILLEFTLPAAITLVMLWLLQPLARRLGLLDHPDERKDHAEPTAATGGLAMAVGIFLPMMWFTTASPAMLAFMAAAMLLVLVGFLDDRHDLRWWVRLLAQCAAVLVMVYGGGVRVEHIGHVFGVESTGLGVFSVPFTVFATVGVINALNMTDGVDGLAGSISLATLGMLAMAAVHSGNTELAERLVVFCGALLGFLLMNMRFPWQPRARVFMGNAGSAFLGFTIAWVSFRLTQNPTHPVTPILAPWLVATPLIDCVVLIVRRLHRGQSPFRADRAHMHHLMLDAGFSPTQVAMTLTAINLLLGLGAAVALRLKVPQPLLVLSFVAICLWYFWLTARRGRAVDVFVRLNRILTRSHLKSKGTLLASPEGSEVEHVE
jgi:UDP-GlcNAc:undecaprenyl-phosphate GlcNAc-1-phosphate transferase